MGFIRHTEMTKDSGKKIKVHIETYANAEDVVKDCQNRSVRENLNEYAVKDSEIEEDWHGVASYQEALNLMKTGYQPTVEQLKKSIEANQNGDQSRYKFFNEIQGFAPVVPLVLSNVPQCMLNMSMTRIKAKVIDLYYDMTANCTTKVEQFVKAGGTVLGSILDLERRGYRFNLYAVQTYSDGDKICTLCVKVKSSDRPLDIRRISFPLTHPAFFRVIGFDWQGKSPASDWVGYGRGRAVNYNFSKSEIKKYVKTAFGDNATYISCAEIISKDKNYVKEELINDVAKT